MNYSISEENYIKNIYHLQQQTTTVTTNCLASELNTKPASVTDMLKKLQIKNLVEYQKYRGFKLNNAGNKVAINIIRRHRLWEYFLVHKLGFQWDEVHTIADELEHINHLELINKLDNFLNFPQTDPHGDPIPDAQGKMAIIKQIALAEMPAKKLVVVSSVSDQSTEMLEMLKHYHIGIGTSIKIIKHFTFDKSVEIKVSQQAACIISGQLAKNIFVHHD